MITAILTAAVVCCLLFGRLSVTALAPLCAGLGLVTVLLGRHRHTRFLSIDIYAQISRLSTVNPTLKFFSALVLMLICAASRNLSAGIFLAAVMLSLVVFIGGLKLGDYVRLLALPVSFLMISGLAMLFEVRAEPAGVININVFGGFLCVTAAAQIRTALVISRAFGAVSCLYMLSLTTPMSELIGVLRRIKCPGIIIGLMYLIYRYIFILLDMYHTMRDAAKSRLGYSGNRAGMRTTGNLFANLLSRSYRQAGKSFDSMESRCFDMEIRFLENRQSPTGAQIAAAAGIIMVTACLAILPY